MALSYQRLGDNPRDHDGSFHGFSPASAADVTGLKPDADPASWEEDSPNGKDQFHAWNIYPPPPPPHWHWKPAEDGIRPEISGEISGTSGGSGTERDSLQRQDFMGINRSGSSGDTNGVLITGRDARAFELGECEIPREAKMKCDFGLNDEGVFEVWYEEDDPAVGSSSSSKNDQPNGIAESTQGLGIIQNGTRAAEGDVKVNLVRGKGKQRVSRVPSLREYFTDLDYLLGVCCDGPAKSFAFRRLKYLASKWSMYCLLNEYQELADMKVSAIPRRAQFIRADRM